MLKLSTKIEVSEGVNYRVSKRETEKLREIVLLTL